jgi:glyoxylase-like metal-dependent hydrolase (beta-lactamase superfamily II)
MCVSTGPDGILLIDTEFAPLTPKIVAAIAKIQPGPIKFLFNTHWHTDHTGGNADFARAGTIIFALDRSRTRMMSEQYFKQFNHVIPASPPSAWPVLTFPREMTLHWNGEDVRFWFHVAAHTDCDTMVWFPKSNVLHLGDIFINGLYPLIDIHGGGHIDGYVPACDDALALINDDTKVIPGHGSVATKKELQAYRDMLATLRDRVAAMIAAGKSLPEILAANPSRDLDPVWASDRVGPDDIVTMMHESLTGPSAP